jgi:hypothetical protein
MRWAILDSDDVVVRVVEADDPPACDVGERVVKGHDASCAVGRWWNGWTFEEVIL